MAARKRRAGKGTFSDLRLPVAGSYVRPAARSRLLVAGGVVFAALLAAAAFNLFVAGGGMLSNGPLSSNHANLEADCDACHSRFADVTDAACSSCHEKYGDELGVYTFAAHYLYRSTDFERLVPSPEETPCFACHLEHLGRGAEITRVPDARCLSCHRFGSFNRDHPEFDFAADGRGDDGTLRFPHVHHTAEVMKRRQLEDVEQACLHCHNPRPDGKSFQPLDFDRHCDACHLTTAVRTPPLPIRDAADGGAGVLTLEAIQRQGGPGTRWAYFLNPGELRQLGGRVVKGPLYHRDPWVLENLRALRRMLYPEAGLADLLTASAEVPAAELLTLYREAIANLEAAALGLRSRPEPQIQDELARIDGLLDELRRRLEDPYAPLDETKFLLALGPPAEDLSAAEVEAIDAVVEALTEPCRQCHRIDDATVARVQADQRTLRRAEFDHRAHIVQRRCLDCHVEIPILDFLDRPDQVDPAVDAAAVYNLPRIEQCRECHNRELAANRCVTCHLFHPDQSRRSHLLLYLEGAGE